MSQHWLVRPENIRRLWITFAVVLIVTVLADLLVHHHTYFTVDGSFGFGAWFGFFSCVGLVAFAKLLSVFLKRKDSYYDR